MERLTERFENGQVGTLGCGNNCKYNYRYCDNALENCPTIAKIFEKLADYEDAEEQGLLLRLPCKVGDTVYVPTRNFVSELRIILISIERDNIFFHWRLNTGIYPNLDGFTSSYIGKMVFFTCEEAEAKLKEMECNHE